MFSLNNLKARRLRSWLTILGVIIGVAAVVGLMLIGAGLENAIQAQFEKAGVDKIIVTPGRGFGLSGGITGADKLYEHDVDLIERVRGVDKAGGMISKTAKVEFRNDIEYTFVIGMTEDISMEDWGAAVEHGREIRDSDEYKVLIGWLLYNDDFFEKPVKVGNEIQIQDQTFEVIGSVEKIGNNQDDSQIYIPLETAQEIFDEEGYNMIMLKTKDGFDTREVANDIKERLRKDRDLKRGEEDFTVQTFEQLMETFSDILSVVQITLIGIAGISLLVGGVGIMNTMYTSVVERTRQIGVMKAIGAKDKHILTIFVLESGIIGLVGGVIGVGIGIGISKLVEIAAIASGFGLMKIIISPTIIIGALLFAFFVGVLSGFAPARQASKLNPIEALRYE
jgi:putative ABC transport system permease protein